MSTSDERRGAALTPQALTEEIEADRRAERRLVTIALVAVAVTVALLVLRGLW